MKTTNKSKPGTLLLGVIFLFCAVVTMQGWAQDRSRPVSVTSGKGWQHLALTNTIGATNERDLAKNINNLGKDGWELVSVGHITQSGTTTETIFYFKKPL